MSPKLPVVAETAPQVQVAAAVSEESEPLLSGEAGPLLRRADPRRLGDVLVYRFERKGRAPLVLSEKVDAQTADTTEVVVSLEEGEHRETLRLVLSRLSERLIRVTKDNEDRTPLTLAAYEKLMAKTTFSPEENWGLVESSHGTCLLGSAEAECETKKYRVKVGESEADFTLQRAAHLGRDVLGEVITDEGIVLYRVNLIEAVRGPEVIQEKSSQALRERTVRETYLSGEPL